jgi:GNAT superfamily N-acetyltransferase
VALALLESGDGDRMLTASLPRLDLAQHAQGIAVSVGAVLALPSLYEVRLYLRNNGLRRSLMKGLTAYFVGRQRWYLTHEDLTSYIGQPIRGNGFQYRRARLGEVPRMKGLMERMPEAVLRRWCGPGYFFFVTWKDGEAVSYRCLSTYVHPGVSGFIHLAPHQVFMVDEFTVPKYRRRGITRQMAYAMAPWVVGQGYREVLGIHRTDNHDTVAAARAKGVTRLGIVTRSRLLWTTRLSYEPESRGPRPRPVSAAPILIGLAPDLEEHVV